MKSPDAFVADATIGEISSGDFGGWRLQQKLMEFALGPCHRGEQIATVELACLRFLIGRFAQLNPRAIGKHFEGFAEFQTFGPHQEAEHVASDVADPTFERLPFRIHLETGARIVMPGTEADKVSPLAAQGHVASHEVDDVDRLANLFLGILKIVERHGNVLDE